MKYWPTKAPTAVIVYGLDWGPTLARLGDSTIVLSSWDVISGDVVLSAATIDPDGRGTNVQVAGGTNESISIVRNTVTLSDGEVIPVKIMVKVKA